MKKNILNYLVISFLLINFTFLGITAFAAENKEVKFKTIVDILDRQVEVPLNIKSIVMVPIPYTSMTFAIDESTEKLIAIHPSAKRAYNKSILKIMDSHLASVPDNYIGGASRFSLNIEEIIKLRPDVVVTWSKQKEQISKLEKLKIPVIALTNGASSNINDLRKNIAIMGELLSKEEKSQKLTDYGLKTEKYFINKVISLKKEEKPKVLYLRDQNLKAAVGGSFNQKMIELAGGINVAAQVKGAWTKVSMEQIIAWNPEIIYLSHFDDFQPEDLYANKIPGQDWSQIQAVKNKKIYKTPIGIYRWDAPNAETPLFLKWMGQIQQPQLYCDYNLEDDIKDFYQDFFNYKLEDKELDKILNK